MGISNRQQEPAEALRARRLKARQLLDAGFSQAEVARSLRVSRQSVSRWARMPRTVLEATRRRGPKPLLGNSARAELVAMLVAGPHAAGFRPRHWTIALVQQLIAERFEREFSAVHVWRLLGELGFRPADFRPARIRHRRRERG